MVNRTEGHVKNIAHFTISKPISRFIQISQYNIFGALIRPKLYGSRFYDNFYISSSVSNVYFVPELHASVTEIPFFLFEGMAIRALKSSAWRRQTSPFVDV